MAQQTAVEWLIEQLKKNENIRWRGAPVSELTEQAKEMEKEQICEAWKNGNLPTNLGRVITEEEYYKEKYNK